MRKIMFWTAPLLLAATSTAAFAAPKMETRAVPSVTIPNVTLQSVRLTKGIQVPGSNASQAIAQIVYADATGRTLYTYDKDAQGKSNCVAECATAWPPLVATKGAAASGDWSVIDRGDGTSQWAHDGHPLYTSAKDTALGTAAGHNLDGAWKAALLDEPGRFTVPTEINVEESLAAPGLVLVNGQRMPLYTFDAKPKQQPDAGQWQPVKASALAIPVGDFTAIKRADGIAQWAYQGKPLFTFKGDMEFGDTNGKGVDPRLQLAIMRSYFMPADVKVRADQKRGGVLTTADGHTLYARDRAVYTGNGAHNARNGARGTPATGIMIGLSGCTDACLTEWQPLLAPADAQASGYWSIFTGEDGTKQWGYQGYALYSYKGESPGVVTAHDTYSFTINHTTQQLGDAKTGLGVYWRVVTP